MSVLKITVVVSGQDSDRRTTKLNLPKEGVSRIAPATPGLLNMICQLILMLPRLENAIININHPFSKGI